MSSQPRISSAVSSGSSTCGQCPTSSRTIQSACGQLALVARRGARPGQELVLGAPDDPQRARDRVQWPVVAGGERDHPRCLAAVGRGGKDTGQRCRSLSHPTGRAPSRRSVGTALRPSVSCLPAASPQPPAGANAVTDRARPRAASWSATYPPSELPTTCAVSHARLVHHPLDRFDHRRGGRLCGQRRAAEVARERWHEHRRAPALQPRPHQLPHVPGAGEAVDQDQRGQYSATMNGGWNRSAVERDVRASPSGTPGRTR